MKQTYREAVVTVLEELREPVIALLAEIGFSAFEETNAGVKAYIEDELFAQDSFESVMDIFRHAGISYEHRIIPAKNWNAEWEKNYPSVFIGEFCQVVPSFGVHDQTSRYQHTIVIDPKMSFGTGHHETTRLMIRQMEHQDFRQARVLDMGCGTGVLGILAAKMGAKIVLGIDIDSWSKENAEENIERNQISNMQILLGDKAVIPDQEFDVVLANINRNVLLNDIPAYQTKLTDTGQLIISGFYQVDAPLLIATCEDLGLRVQRQMNENNWMAIAFSNQNR